MLIAELSSTSERHLTDAKGPSSPLPPSPCFAALVLGRRSRHPRLAHRDAEQREMTWTQD
ncbi:hypothetical protein [Streptomyces sp. NPDC085479]|uniref:hypothetical protein n=1 Tax=Streptomyces sp. NPDC085479 TaxID=3365726 RepID=UPI0037D96561